MGRIWFASTLPLLLLATVVPSSAEEELDALEIVRRSFAAEQRNDAQREDYVYKRRNEERYLDKRDEVKKTDVETVEILYVYGEEYERVIGRDDRLLPPAEQAKEQRKFDKEVAKRAEEDPKERRKRLKKEAEAEEDRRRMIAEIVRAYDFSRLPDATYRGVECYVIEADPRPGFEPEFRRARFLNKLRGKLWISKSDYNWVRAEAETTDNVAFGLFLFKLKKGAVMEFEQTKVNDEVWLLDRIRAKFHGKVGFVKGLRREYEARFSDFRKFSAESKLLAADPSAEGLPAEDPAPVPETISSQ